MNKYQLFSCLFLTLLIAACVSDNSRYGDNTSLERPPEGATDKQAPELNTDEGKTEAETVPKRRGKGLKSDVYRVDGSAKELKIKRTFDEAWSLLNQAIQLNDIKINDQDRSKGTYYLAYGEGNLFGLTSLFSKKSDLPTYLLKVEPEGQEVKVTVSFADTHEQSDPSRLKDGVADDSAEDKSEQLTELLYDTLHDKVKDD